jgi:hypothetical protein
MRSSAIEAAKKSDDGRDLHIRWVGGREYGYAGAGWLWSQLVAAPSRGIFVNRQVKAHYTHYNLP